MVGSGTYARFVLYNILATRCAFDARLGDLQSDDPSPTGPARARSSQRLHQGTHAVEALEYALSIPLTPRPASLPLRVGSRYPRAVSPLLSETASSQIAYTASPSSTSPARPSGLSARTHLLYG